MGNEDVQIKAGPCERVELPSARRLPRTTAKFELRWGWASFGGAVPRNAWLWVLHVGKKPLELRRCGAGIEDVPLGLMLSLFPAVTRVANSFGKW